MTHRLVTCFVITSLSVAAPRPAAAEATDVYDTVDSVEVNTGRLVLIGIPAGGTTPVTTTYNFGFSDMAMHCQRLAVVAMSKPGKFQFAIGPSGNFIATGCKLTLRAP